MALQYSLLLTVASSIGCQSLWDAQHRRLCNDPTLLEWSQRTIKATITFITRTSSYIPVMRVLSFVLISPKSPTCGGLASWPALEALSSAQMLHREMCLLDAMTPDSIGVMLYSEVNQGHLREERENSLTVASDPLSAACKGRTSSLRRARAYPGT